MHHPTPDNWLHRFLAGQTATHMALMQLFMESDSEIAARQTLQNAIAEAPDAGGAARLRRLQQLWDNLPNAYSVVSQVHRAASRTPERGENPMAQFGNLFDSAAKISPEAGVALYSLGDRNLLDIATAEIVALMRRWNLFGRNSLILEIGCGAGRFLGALAPLVRGIVGIDISQGMLRRARERTRCFPNALAVRVSGEDLDLFADHAFDLVLAVDSFPYLVDEGAAPRCFADCARILNDHGRMLILNFDYSGDVVRQRDCVEQLAEQNGFVLQRNGTCDLNSWDGKTFLLDRKPAQASAAT